MKYIVKSEEDPDKWFNINNISLNEKIYQEEMSEYEPRDREDFIDNLIDLISEATRDKDIMKEDLKYLISLDDEIIFSSISTNDYVAYYDNPDKFNSICENLIKLTKDLEILEKTKKN